MKIFVISDNVDTAVGMRLAGIEGEVVHTGEEVENALINAADNPEIGIILITEKLVSLCTELVYDLKLNRAQPLIVTIPDRHGMGRSKDAITKYVREAIGLKI